MNVLKKLSAFVLSVAIPAASWANISNTASVAYQDAAANNLAATSNTVSITTPPTVTGGSLTLDVGVAMSPYQIVGTNSPTSYSAPGLPAGLSVNTSNGQITGTPTAGGLTSVTIGATNAAGTGTATLTITVRSAANIALTKSASVANAKSGDTVTFTIQYQNTGSGAASNVTITDVIPTGSTLVAGSISNGGTASAGTITWNIGAVATSGSGSVTFKVTVN